MFKVFFSRTMKLIRHSVILSIIFKRKGKKMFLSLSLSLSLSLFFSIYLSKFLSIYLNNSFSQSYCCSVRVWNKIQFAGKIPVRNGNACFQKFKILTFRYIQGVLYSLPKRLSYDKTAGKG